MVDKNSASPAALLDCFIEECTPQGCKGWIGYREGGHNIQPDMYIDEVFIERILCDLDRPDVASQDYAVNSGFLVSIPERYLDRATHVLTLRLDGEVLGFYAGGQKHSAYYFALEPPPQVRGNVEGLSNGVFRGWVAPEEPHEAGSTDLRTVKITCDEEVVGFVKADRYRPDVAETLQCDPYCGFVFDPPAALQGPVARKFRFFLASTGSELPNSPYVTSFVTNQLAGKLIAVQEQLSRIVFEVDYLKNEMKSIIAAKRYTIETYDFWFEKYISALRLKMERRRIQQAFVPDILVSVICPVYRPSLENFKSAVQSVLRQTYGKWELLLIDDGSDDESLSEYLRSLEKIDSRVRVVVSPRNLGISGATNLGVDSARGEWLALFDHDDLLEDVALEVMLLYASSPNIRMMYSDEDKIDVAGYYCDPALKPDWNYRYVLSLNYICHFLMIRKEDVVKVGKFRSQFDGAQDHDLVLRLASRLTEDQIVHVPEVLYHWRKGPQSTADLAAAKSYAVAAGLAAVKEHINVKHPKAEVENIFNLTWYKINWRFVEQPLVHIIIPFRDQAKMTEQCLDAILDGTAYENFRITLVDNWSVEPATQALVAKVKRQGKAEIVRIEEEFNYSKFNNLAARRAPSDFLFFMNNDLIVEAKDWLRVVVDEALADPRVAAVGGKFVYPNWTIQHAGVALGIGGVAGHLHSRTPAKDPGYLGGAAVAHELSAVTAAGMLVNTEAFWRVGGFDEVHLKVAFNDVDLCLKLRQSGRKIVWTPDFMAVHYESLSRGSDTKTFKKARFDEEVEFMLRKWGDVLKQDPHYSRFFERNGAPFRDLIDPEAPAFP